MMLLTRRHFFRWLLGLAGLFSLPFIARETQADPRSSPGRLPGVPIGEFFFGEELEYEIGFWLLKRAAIARASFQRVEGKDQFLGTIQGETQGVLGWLARYRVDTYRSTMEVVEGGTRLRSLCFEEEVRIGTKVRRKIHLLDYAGRKWTTKKLRKNGTWEIKEEPIPEGMVYDDFITAAYNFRYGVYGPVERGRVYRVATFPRKGATSYEVRVVEKREEEKMRRAGTSKDGKDLFAKLFLDPEVTHSKDGLIEGWLTEDLYPIEGTIKDVIIVGDIRGRLIRRVRGS